ncbi:hypothetical protein HK405_014708 [Cladochytrium tenue]|nr:hypothetical protein HK405_014708 [Cladochytrium tenue]
MSDIPPPPPLGSSPVPGPATVSRSAPSSMLSDGTLRPGASGGSPAPLLNRASFPSSSAGGSTAPPAGSRLSRFSAHSSVSDQGGAQSAAAAAGGGGGTPPVPAGNFMVANGSYHSSLPRPSPYVPDPYGYAAAQQQASNMYGYYMYPPQTYDQNSWVVPMAAAAAAAAVMATDPSAQASGYPGAPGASPSFAPSAFPPTQQQQPLPPIPGSPNMQYQRQQQQTQQPGGGGGDWATYSDHPLPVAPSRG